MRAQPAAPVHSPAVKLESCQAAAGCVDGAGIPGFEVRVASTKVHESAAANVLVGQVELPMGWHAAVTADGEIGARKLATQADVERHI